MATYDMPLLILHGELDPRTPVEEARALAEHATGKTYFVEVPDGVHSAVTRTVTRDGAPCGVPIFAQFLQDPETEPDTSCVSNVPKLDMVIDDGFLWSQVIGTSDQWGDEE